MLGALVVKLAVALDLFLPQPIVGDVVRDAVEPGVEARIQLEARQGAPSLDEGLLREVPGLGFVLDEMVSHGVDPPAILCHQGVKGPRVARLAAFDQVDVRDFAKVSRG